MECPLCSCLHSISLRAYDVDELSSLWKKSYGFDPFACEGIKTITKKQCTQCDLIYFDPPLYGDGGFYEKLSKGSAYYEKDKWEFDIAARVVAEARPESFLEIGCGAGCFLEKITSIVEHVEGLDINKDGVSKCVEKGLLARTASVADLEKSYDVIALFEVLEHMDDLSVTVREIVNRLASGGRLILAVPNPEGYLKEMDMNLLDMPPHHNSSWPKETFDYLASLYELEIVGYYKEPLRFVHYCGYVWNIVDQHRRLMPHGVRKKIFSFVQTAFIHLVSPFAYIQQRDSLVGQTHLVVLKKR